MFTYFTRFFLALLGSLIWEEENRDGSRVCVCVWYPYKSHDIPCKNCTHGVSKEKWVPKSEKSHYVIYECFQRLRNKNIKK
jgi:hypothetical protein